MLILGNKNIGKYYQLRDGKDNRDFIFEDIELDPRTKKFRVKCKIAPEIGKKPDQDHYIDLGYFNEFAFRYGNDYCANYENHYTHDWDYDIFLSFTGVNYSYITNCKRCGITVSDFDAAKKRYLSCDEVTIKDIIT